MYSSNNYVICDLDFSSHTPFVPGVETNPLHNYCISNLLTSKMDYSSVTVNNFIFPCQLKCLYLTNQSNQNL